MQPIRILFHIGRYVMMVGSAIARPEKQIMYYRETVRQIYDIGIGSLPIVFLISVFIGAVAALQFAFQLDGTLVPMWYIGYIVRDFAIIEASPTITCLVLAGKVGSNMASEIGGMRQKEHIDAMEIMGVNTSAYLIMPKIVAALIAIPILVSLSAFISMIGGYLAVVPTGLISDPEYTYGLRSFFNPYNIRIMYVKAFVFAYLLTTVSCYQGYYVKAGSIALGKASTDAVVYSNILILLADYLIAVLLT